MGKQFKLKDKWLCGVTKQECEGICRETHLHKDYKWTDKCIAAYRPKDKK